MAFQGNRHALHAVRDDQVVQGRILWLPAQRNDPNLRIRIRPYDAFAGAIPRSMPLAIFRHPVVIVSRPSVTPHLVHVVVMTSFRGRHIAEAFQSDRADDVRDYLPLVPSVHVRELRNQADYRPLALANGAHMNRSSYARVDNVYQVPWTELECNRSGGVAGFLLDESSIRRLLRLTRRRCHYQVAEQHKLLAPVQPIEQIARPPSVPSPPHQPQPHIHGGQRLNYAQVAAARVDFAELSRSENAQQSDLQGPRLGSDVQLWDGQEPAAHMRALRLAEINAPAYTSYMEQIRAWLAWTWQRARGAVRFISRGLRKSFALVFKSWPKLSQMAA